MDLLSVWFCIVGSVLLFAVALLPATMILAGGNRDRLAELMAAHERNLQSDDPQTVADAPPCIKIGKSVRYRQSDVEAWLWKRAGVSEAAITMIQRTPAAR